MKKQKTKLSIVIPAYNEEQRIQKTLSAFEWHFSKRHNTEIIVVCDGNTDKTPEIVSKYSKRHKHVRLLTFPTRLGKGGGLAQGLKVAKGDLIGFVDADSSTSTADYDHLISALQKSKKDGAICSRYLKKSRVLVSQPFYRKFLSRGWNLLMRILFNVPFTDTQCGAKIFKKEAIQEVLPKMQSHGFEFDVELLWRMQKAGYKIAEIPTTWLHMEQSKFRVKDILGMFWRLLKIRLAG